MNDNGDMNRFDEFALEEALKIKEKVKKQKQTPVIPVSVDVITAGKSNFFKIIRRAFGMGADSGFLIVLRNEEKATEYIPPFNIASLLSAVAAEMKYDLILTGIMSQDMMHGQTGPMLAELLNFPCATGVTKIWFPVKNNFIQVERELENGFIDCLEIKLPALLTIQAGINTPRYPSLSNLLAAEQKTIIIRKETDIFSHRGGVKEFYVSTETPEKTRNGLVLEGDLASRVNQLLNFFKKHDLN